MNYLLVAIEVTLIAVFVAYFYFLYILYKSIKGNHERVLKYFDRVGNRIDRYNTTLLDINLTLTYMSKLVKSLVMAKCDEAMIRNYLGDDTVDEINNADKETLQFSDGTIIEKSQRLEKKV